MKRIFHKPIVSTATIALGAAFFGYYNNSSVIHNFFGKKSDDSKKSKNTSTWIWGNGFYQARPDIAISFKNFEPKLIKNFNGPKNINLKDVAFGEYHEAGIDINGNLYIWRKHVIDSAVSDKDDERSDIQLLDSGKNVKQITFSKGFIWVLKENGEVYQHLINAKYNKENENDEPIIEVVKTARKINELKGISQISTGQDHFAALDSEGNIWVMGDDTLGQCGLGAENRNTGPPFYERRVKKPRKLESLNNITKVICGITHTLALTKDGSVYGWGSNSNLQLSHQEDFSKIDNPLIAVYSPIKLEKNLDSFVATDIAAGENFSLIVGRNRISKETEVFGCGYNLEGELGGGNLSHIQEIQKIESLSNYKITTPEGEKDVRVDQISCGRKHCMALLNIGAVMEWGANEHGQLGNRKRVFSENPIILKTFAEENVLKVSCGEFNSAVVSEHKEKPTGEQNKK